MLSKTCWKGKCFQCIWANMANVTIQNDFTRNIVKNRFETICYGPLSCKYYKMGPARAVPYIRISGVKDQGVLPDYLVFFHFSVCTEETYPLFFVSTIGKINDFYRYPFNDLIVFFDEQIDKQAQFPCSFSSALF